MSMDIQWDTRELIQGLEAWGAKVLQAVQEVAQYIAPVMESFAKANADWTDRTGNARQGLHAWVEEAARDIVDVYLSHGMEYGKYLEFRWQGKYAIIFPTLEAHFNEILRMLEGIFN